MAIADFYTSRFSGKRSSSSVATVYKDSIYDFLYTNDFEAFFCNSARMNTYPRTLKDWLLQLHTGESLVQFTKNWAWQEREKLGQRYLKDLAECILNWYSQQTEQWMLQPYLTYKNELYRRLELDNYVYRDKVLYFTGADVLNVDQERTLLHHLHSSLQLPDQAQTFEFLKLAEDHFVAGRWSDSISNARKFFEAVLSQIAAQYSVKKLRSELSEKTLSRPVEVRRFLEDRGLIEKRERETIEKTYGLLSQTGGHPYMAENDQARLLRQLCLILTQFALLRLEGALKN
ncbi:MAG: hypothetical protein L6302_07020 [Desulfobacteraceae bacterium]|nr:hypothetical protein [bacterium]MCG2830787.1 hypothetical protein [Desulfobacteraceae bacterium]